MKPNTLIVFKENGDIVETILNGVDTFMPAEELKDVQRYGTIIFDQSFESGYSRVTAYEYIDSDIE